MSGKEPSIGSATAESRQMIVQWGDTLAGIWTVLRPFSVFGGPKVHSAPRNSPSLAECSDAEPADGVLGLLGCVRARTSPGWVVAVVDLLCGADPSGSAAH